MYTSMRFATVLLGAVIACAAGAQPRPDDDRGPPDDRQTYDQGPGAFDAQDQDAQDPPARVARLSHMNGAVSFTPAGESEWVEAQLNRPIVTGDKLWTGGSARAELEIGAASVAMDHGTSFDFLNLNDGLAQMELTQGTLRLDVRRVRNDESFEVDTPTIAFVAARPGDYRIDVDPQGGTVVSVLRGAGDAIGEGGKRVTVEEGQSVRFNDSLMNDYQVDRVRHGDEFDRYCDERHERFARPSSRSYVSEEVTGYEDLDEYGSWDDAPEYGHVWYPREVAADWAPYHDGDWQWIDPWGWTWVDNAPWGFAPFHYGRWAYIGSRWGWVPGPLDVEPVYAPALVAFVGGGGFGVDISIGGPVGWFALGPRDVYFPGYRCGRDYFARVNLGNAYVQRTVINNYYGDWSRGRLDYGSIRYANRDAPRALVAMSGSAFVSGRPVRSAAIAVNEGTFANARVMARPGLTPTRDSLFAGRGRAAAPPQAALRRTVVAAHQPAPPRPSFAQRQSVLQRNGGQPLTVAQMRNLSPRANGGARGAVANNVRVIGGGRGSARGAAPNAAQERSSAAADAARNGRMQRDDRATVSANGRRNDAGSPSRAPEMNRSPERANAQYLRSAGFAHQGVVPGSERSANAQARANERGLRDVRANADARNNIERRGRVAAEQRGRGAGNEARLNSSRFAHAGERAPADAGRADAQRRQDQARMHASARNDVAARERANAMRQQAQARSRASARSDSAARERASAMRQQQAQSEARSRASARNDAMARERAGAMRQQQAQAEARSRASARNDAMARERAGAMRQQQAQAEARSRASARNDAMARERAGAMRQQQAQAEARSRASQRNEAAARENAMRQQAEMRSRAEARAPQPQSRPAPQQRQVARSAPERSAPRENPRKKRDEDKGG